MLPYLLRPQPPALKLLRVQLLTAQEQMGQQHKLLQLLSQLLVSQLLTTRQLQVAS